MIVKRFSDERAEEKKSSEEFPIPAVETGEKAHRTRTNGVRERRPVKFHGGMERRNGP